MALQQDISPFNSEVMDSLVTAKDRSQAFTLCRQNVPAFVGGGNFDPR